MGDVYKRIFLKPEGVSADELAKLTEGLRQAVAQQCELAARSPHILELDTEIRDEGTVLAVSHEPATPLSPAELFDPSVKPIEPSELLRVTAAVFDGLSAAHDTPGPKSSAHGGICPGVVLKASDGTYKVSDFGFAPTICRELGVERYLETAIGPPSAGEPALGTGIWQILAENDDSRDDRLCAFIDPFKYMTGTLHTFEPASDVVAAGSLLRLLADHRHPRLSGRWDHQLVATSQLMGQNPYLRFPAKELRESPDAAIRAWCDIVSATLRMPDDRPAVREVLTDLARVGVKPVGRSTILQRRIALVRELIEVKDWQSANEETKALLADPDIGPEQRTQVQAHAREVEAHSLMESTRRALNKAEFDDVERGLETIVDLPPPQHLVGAFDELFARLNQNREAQTLLEQLATIGSSVDTMGVLDAIAVVDRELERLRAMPAESLVPPLVQQRNHLLSRLVTKRDELHAERALIAEDHARVEAWLTALIDAWENGRWEDVERQLNAPPDAEHWPVEAQERTAEMQSLFIRVQAAASWPTAAAEAAQTDDLGRIEQVLADRPDSSGLITTLTTEIDEAARALETARANVIDARVARDWIKRVERLIAAEDWQGAQHELRAKPNIASWDPAILEREKACWEQIRTHLAEKKRRKKAVEGWLRTADEATARGEWERAIGILDTPPIQPEQLSRAVTKEVAQRRARCAAGLEKQRAEERDAREARLQALVSTLVKELLSKQFAGLLNVNTVSTALETVRHPADHASALGTAEVVVTIKKGEGCVAQAPCRCSLEFEADGVEVKLGAAEDLRDRLQQGLREQVKQLQTTCVGQLQSRLRRGLFPDLVLDVAYEDPAARGDSTVKCLGRGKSEGDIAESLQWDPGTLTWRVADEPGFVERALELLLTVLHQHCESHLIHGCRLAEQYRSLLNIRLSRPVLRGLSDLQGDLEVPYEVTLDPHGSDGKLILRRIIRAGSVNDVSIGATQSILDNALRKIVCGLQMTGRDRLCRPLQAEHSLAKIKASKPMGRIKNPVAELSLTVRARGVADVQLVADWRVDSCLFELNQEAKERLARYKELPPEPDVVHKKLWVASSTIGIMAIVAAFIVLWSGGPSTPPLDPEPPPTPTRAQVLARYRERFEAHLKSDPLFIGLSDDAWGRVVSMPREAGDAQDTHSATFRIGIPGLRDLFIARVELVLPKSLPDEQLEQLDDDISRLQTRLDDSARAGLRDLEEEILQEIEDISATVPGELKFKDDALQWKLSEHDGEFVWSSAEPSIGVEATGGAVEEPTWSIVVTVSTEPGTSALVAALNGDEFDEQTKQQIRDKLQGKPPDGPRPDPQRLAKARKFVVGFLRDNASPEAPPSTADLADAVYCGEDGDDIGGVVCRTSIPLLDQLAIDPMTEEGRAALEGRFNEVQEELGEMSVEAPATWMNGVLQGFGEYIAADAVTISVLTDGPWNLALENRIFVWGPAVARVRMEWRDSPAGADESWIPIPHDEAGRTIECAVKVSKDTAVIDANRADVVGALRNDLTAFLIDRQQDRLHEEMLRHMLLTHFKGLGAEDIFGTVGLELSLPDAEMPTDEAILTLTVPEPLQQPRTVRLSWNRTSLTFQPDRDDLNGLVDDYNCLQKMNELLRNNRDHWLHDLGGEVKLVEGFGPEGDPDIQPRSPLWSSLPLIPFELPSEVHAVNGTPTKGCAMRLTDSKQWWWPLVQWVAKKEHVVRTPAEFTAFFGQGAGGTEVWKHFTNTGPVRRESPSLILPRFRVTTDAAGKPKITVVGQSTSAILTCRVDVDLVVDNLSDRIRQRLNIDDIHDELAENPDTALNDEIAILIPNVSNGDRGPQLNRPSSDAVHAWLQQNVGTIQGLDRALRLLEDRLDVEDQLSRAWNGADRGRQEQDVRAAMGLLKAIAKAKAGLSARATRRTWNDFVDGVREVPSVWSASGVRQGAPTVFIEFFNGVDDTYAIAWSRYTDVNEGTKLGGPWVVRLGATAELLASRPGRLGGVLFDPVLSKVSEALSNAEKLGVIVAADWPLMQWCVANEVPLEELGFTQRVSKELDVVGRGGTRSPLAWSRLVDLRAQDGHQSKLQANYLIVASLSDQSRKAARTGANWDVLLFEAVQPEARP